MANGNGHGGEHRRQDFTTGDSYAAGYLASKHHISTQQARDLIAEVGTDRERLNLVASKVRAASGR